MEECGIRVYEREGQFFSELELEFPYRHTTGETIGTFLGNLRAGRIVGRRCARCGIVAVPPLDTCDTCAGPLVEWVPIEGSGTIICRAIVNTPTPPQVGQEPFAFALIRLDGAGTNLLHIVKADDLSAVVPGARVQVRWSAVREGSILDIACFVLADRGDDGT